MKTRLQWLLILLAFPLWTWAAGTTRQTATSLKSGSILTGSLSAERTEEWYKLEVPRDGSIKLWWSPADDLDIGYVIVCVLNTENGVFERAYKWGGSQQGEILVPDALPGTYYVKVNRNDGQGAYRMQYKFEQNDYATDAEPNNDLAHALPLANGVTVAGHLGYTYYKDTDAEDWYKVTLTQKGIEFTVKPSGNLSVKYATLYSADGTEIGYKWVDKEEQVFKAKNLAAGTYYIRIQHNSGSGTYFLSVGAPIGTVEKLDPLPDETPDDEEVDEPLPGDGTGTEYTYNPKTQTVTIEKTTSTAPYIIACGPFDSSTPVVSIEIPYTFFRGLPSGDVSVGAATPPTVTGGSFDVADVGSRTLHVPSGKKQTYQKDPNWGLFGTIKDDYGSQDNTPEGPRLVVWLKSGEKVVFELADAPVTTFSNGQLIIRTNKVTIPYDRSSVLRYTYEDVTDKGVELMPGERRVEMNREGDEVILRGLQADTKASVYSVNGTLLEQREATDGLPLTISLKKRPNGVYIIKAGTETIKLMKQ